MLPQVGRDGPDLAAGAGDDRSNEEAGATAPLPKGVIRRDTTEEKIPARRLREKNEERENEVRKNRQEAQEIKGEN